MTEIDMLDYTGVRKFSAIFDVISRYISVNGTR